MRLFYKIWLSGEHDEADILSFAFADDAGKVFYAECDNYDQDKIDEWADRYIISEFLGEAGFTEAVPNNKKMVAVEGSLEYCIDRLHQWLGGYGYLELVSDANYHEVQALLYLIDWDAEKRHINIINIADKQASRYNSLFEVVRTDLPDYNAARFALTYKHMAIKIARDAKRASI
jgi:hypothetical protein